MGLSASDKLRMIERAVEAIEHDQSIWPSKPLTGYEGTLVDVLKSFLNVCKSFDEIALERLEKKHGAV